ncbi:hypothetical protein ACLGIH_34255 [Streptomyces sp. HMX87]|uniref:hypothetical protein n=1 Tax=Streptomyces sp. HMX87 TaxID=3390849 RepID=UPI003A8976A0
MSSEPRAPGLSRGLVAELTVRCDDEPSATRVALAWLTDGVQSASGGLDVQAFNPAVKVAASGYQSIPHALLGGDTGAAWGYITASPADSWGVLYNPYGPDSVPWLREQIEARAESVAVEVGGGEEVTSGGPGPARLSVAFDEDLAGHVRLRWHVEEQQLLGTGRGGANQRTLASVLREFAHAYPVVFAHLSHETPDSQTEWEKCLRGMRSDPAANTTEWPDRLRGYSWITVAPEPAAQALGGADALRSTGAFSEVEVLPNGSFWLKATDDYRDYDPAHVRRVWQATRNALIPGDPKPPGEVPGGGSAWMVAFE